jgi:Asp-tRNA(Asn)/Glu-tRNA(Gln) amidotransferase A subunit family amidase
VIGYKATINRWIQKDEVKFFNIRESMGCLGVSMEDIAFIDQVVTNEKHEKIEMPSQVRIGIP